MKLPHEVDAEFFITEQRGKRAGESPKPHGSIDLVVYVVRTAGDAVEKHTCPSPTRVRSRGAVCGAVCAPRRARVRQVPARGRPRVWTSVAHALRLGLRWDSVQQCVWTAVTWRSGWALLTPSASPPARAHAQPQGPWRKPQRLRRRRRRQRHGRAAAASCGGVSGAAAVAAFAGRRQGRCGAACCRLWQVAEVRSHAARLWSPTGNPLTPRLVRTALPLLAQRAAPRLHACRRA